MSEARRGHPLSVSTADEADARERFMGSAPGELGEELAVAWDQLAEASAEQDIALEAGAVPLEELARVWACSRFVASWCVRNVAAFGELLASGDLARAYAEGEMAARVTDALAHATDEDALKRALRRVRNREQVRVAWRDLTGAASLEETLADLSALADACIGEALADLEARQRKEWGTPRDDSGEAQSLVVLGLGKLGGRELNFSSDVDLIFAFPEHGSTDGPRAIENERFFTRLAQRLVRALSEPTADGFAYRVDTRLRPFGDSGPLVLSFTSMESYYETHGREWERYAFIKARVIADADGAGERLMETLAPFVYRRYIDYGAIDSLRGMKSLIAREVQRQGLEDDIKMGAGGIREIEFIGQVFQLIRGGREPGLRERGILTVLERLGEREILAPHMARDLDAAYRYLRRTENRLQAVADRQTQQLPKDATERRRLAFAMGEDDWERFVETLDGHRERVHEEFEQVFASPQTEESENGEGELELLWEDALDEAEQQRVLAAAGFADAEAAHRRLAALRDGGVVASLTPEGRRRLARLIPLLVGAAGASPVPDTALERLLMIVETIARRSTYLVLLAENPMALSQLARLCAASPWITELLARHPVLLDELLDPRTLYNPPDRDALGRALDEALAGCSDLEEEMEALRYFRQSAVLRVAAADVAGNVPLMRASDHLTDIAEVILERVLELGWAEMTGRHGEPRCRDGEGERTARFGIVAYGKLGGIELGYGSDLDLVFVHDSAGEDQVTDGERSLDNAVFFARLGQRILHLLTTRTPAGTVYEVDTRLRPSGRAGLLVTSLAGLEEYQQRNAWTWEHQALVRARPVAGSPEISQEFRDMRARVLGQRRDAEALRREVRDMRARMLDNLGSTTAGRFDIKQDTGGVADIEFMVQYGVLRWAADHPAVLTHTDNIRILEAFADEGLLPAADCESLADVYRAYRERLHELALQEAEAVVPEAEFAERRREVTALWQRLMED